MFKNFFENLAVYEIMWENVVHPDKTHDVTWRWSFACRITKAAHTYSQYIILIAFP
jgi:hypothetical protein